MDPYGRDQYGNDPYGDGQYRDPRAYNDPRMAPMAVPMRQAPSVSPMQVKQMITEEMTTQFEKLQNALTQTKREDALQNEIAQMRALMFDVIKSKATEQNAPAAQKQTDPLLASLLSNQSDLNKTLLMNTLNASNKEDPMQKILLQELMELKKVRSAPPLTHTTEELTQRIQLQKLANDLELAQAEFRDKAEGRVFARDLAGQALTKIGESFATAYLESQRTAAMQAAQSQSMGLTPPPAAQIVPPEPVVAESAQKSAPQIDASAQPRVSASQPDEREAEKYHVKGVTQEDGSITIPCPTCGSDIIARPGDTRVVCNMCGSAFTAGSPQQHEYATGETQEAASQTQEAASQTQEADPGSTQEVEEPPRKMPKGIL
jgi:ribosomal protein L37AE/L43A